MKFRHKFAPALIFVIVFLLSTSIIPSATAETTRNDKYMFADEVKPGMKGYGLTVFEGAKIEKFDVEIVGVIYDRQPRSDMILARIAGGPIEVAGVIAGMSGSPIYIDGRIIGALAYSWAFSKVAIAGITPIEEMLRIYDFEERGKGKMTSRSDGSDSGGWARHASLNLEIPTVTSDAVVMKPIMTPMVFSGFSKGTIDVLRPQLEGWGITPMIGGSSVGQSQDAEATLEEGAAVAIHLIRGDMNAAAIGTVTVVDDGKVLAFGHPFMQAGPMELPMSTAYIHTILPNMVQSTKVGSSLTAVGAATQDRAAGVGGRIGAVPDMAPVKLSVRGPGENSLEDYNFEIARNRRLLPSLLVAALRDSFGQASSAAGDYSAKIHYEIKLENYPKIINNDFISGERGFPFITGFGLYQDLTALLNNQYADVRIESISMDVEVNEAVELAQIVGIRALKDTLQPGEELDLRIILKPFMKDSINKPVTITIPDHIVEGQAFAHISAGPNTLAFEAARAPHRFRPADMAGLVELIDEDYPGNRIDVRLLVADPGMVVDGREMAALPSSVISVIAKSMDREPVGVTRASVLFEKNIFMDFEVEGAVIIPITIDRKAH